MNCTLCKAYSVLVYYTHFRCLPGSRRTVSSRMYPIWRLPQLLFPVVANDDQRMITAQYCPLWSTSRQRHEECTRSKSTLENIPYSNCTSENMLTTKKHRRRYPTTMVYQRVYRTVCRRVYWTVCRRVYPTRVHRATYPTGRVRGKIQPTTRTYWQYTRQGYTEEYTLGYSRYSQQGCRTGNKSSKYVCTCTPQLCVLKQQPSHVHLRCTNSRLMFTYGAQTTSPRQSQNILRWHAFLVAFSCYCETGTSHFQEVQNSSKWKKLRTRLNRSVLSLKENYCLCTFVW